MTKSNLIGLPRRTASRRAAPPPTAFARRSSAWRYHHLLELVDEIAADIADRPVRVLEIGASNGKLFAMLDRRLVVNYIGVEPDPGLCEIARERFGARPNFRMIQRSATEAALYHEVGLPDVVIALETCEHETESDAFRIVERIASLDPRLFVCAMPVEVGPVVWIKNLGSRLAGLERPVNRSWSDSLWTGLGLLGLVRRSDAGTVGFDWRRLDRTIRRFMDIVEIRKRPVTWLPNLLSFSLIVVAAPRPRFEPIVLGSVEPSRRRLVPSMAPLREAGANVGRLAATALRVAGAVLVAPVRGSLWMAHAATSAFIGGARWLVASPVRLVRWARGAEGLRASVGNAVRPATWTVRRSRALVEAARRMAIRTASLLAAGMSSRTRNAASGARHGARNTAAGARQALRSATDSARTIARLGGRTRERAHRFGGRARVGLGVAIHHTAASTRDGTRAGARGLLRGSMVVLTHGRHVTVRCARWGHGASQALLRGALKLGRHLQAACRVVAARTSLTSTAALALARRTIAGAERAARGLHRDRTAWAGHVPRRTQPNRFDEAWRSKGQDSVIEIAARRLAMKYRAPAAAPSGKKPSVASAHRIQQVARPADRVARSFGNSPRQDPASTPAGWPFDLFAAEAAQRNESDQAAAARA